MRELTETERAAVIGLATEKLGSQRAVAEIMGVSDMVISHWKKRGVPPERCIDLELATDRAVTRYQLRPDVFGKEPKRVAA